MSALLIQAPDSKRWHIGVFVYRSSTVNGTWLPICKLQPESGPWRFEGSEYAHGIDRTWRCPHGVCSNCSREVESAVRLIATEESR